MAAWRFMRFYSSRPPGYPFFLALVYELFGSSPRAALVAQALVDTLTALMVYYLGRVFLTRSAAYFACGLYALIAYRVGMLMSEVLAAAVFAGVLLLLVTDQAVRKKSMALYAGILYGYLVLVRPQMIIFAPLIALYYGQRLSWPAALRPLVIFGAACALVIAPWLIREYKVHGRFIFLATIGGRTFHQGNDIPIDGHQIMLEARKRGLDEVGMDQMLYRETWDYLKSHPEHAAFEMVRRLGGLWSPFMEGGDELKLFFNPLWRSESRFKRSVAAVGWVGYVCSRAACYLGLLGMLMGRKRIKQLAPLYVIPLWLSLFHFLVFYGIPRYLAPAYPVLCVLAGLVFSPVECRRGGR
jgi:4-amino-4-deoxy-L-arabinose transferase-like glycosyltransferase